MSSDWEFIFDGVFGYLTSPLWIVPLNDFIDAQSVGKYACGKFCKARYPLARTGKQKQYIANMSGCADRFCI